MRFHDTDKASRQFWGSQFQSEEVPYTLDFSTLATRRGTTVSTVTWSQESGANVTIANTALSSGVASAEIKANDVGIHLIKVTATLENGQDRIVYLRIRANNPVNYVRDYA